ncbi:MAG: hypothetical protein COA42_23290 [Alteromonadaceae bacterium]|nr:MAG: hypothetical protein COA42_23290 [Alteromonadaceae bacterium]
MKNYKNISRFYFIVALFLVQACVHAGGLPPTKTLDGLKYIDFGSGEYTLVFETGLNESFDTAWAALIPNLENINQRVIMYSRAGIGGSDSASSYSLDATNKRLNTLLTSLGANNKLFLIGQSYGGLVVRQYATRYPGDVEGLVLLDPAVEGWAQGLMNLKVPGAYEQVNGMNTSLFGMAPDGPNLILIYAGGAMSDKGDVNIDPTLVVTASKVYVSEFVGSTKQGKKLWRELHSALISENSNSVNTISAKIDHMPPPEMIVNTIEQAIYMNDLK